MARLKIKDAPLLTNVIGTEKIPTGSRGDFAITPDMLTQYFINKIPFVTQAQLVSVKADLEAKITTVETTLSQSISALGGRVSNVESAMLGFTQDLALHIADQNNPHNVTKQQIGLGSVDNTSDINKPLSTATKEYVDAKIAEKDKGYFLEYYQAGRVYPKNAEIMLADGTVVQSLINDNTTNPNTDMTGWLRTNSTLYIKNEAGLTQESINKTLLYYTNPKMFGAVGNGVVDDTKPIRDCLNSAIATGKPIIDYTGSTYKFTENITIVAPNKALNIEGNVTFESTTSYITFSGEILEVSNTSKAEAINVSTITLTTVGDLKTNDLITIHNTADYSFSGHRPYYRDGEFNVVQSITDNTVLLEHRLASSYPAQNVVVAKISPIKLNIQGVTFNCSSYSSLRIMLAIDSTINCNCYNLLNPSNASYALGLDRVYSSKVTGGRYVKKGLGTSGADYGIVLSNCQDVIVSAEYTYGHRHGIAMGGGTGLGTVANRRNIVQQTTIDSSQTIGLHTADIHGNSIDCNYEDCVVYGLLGIGGSRCYSKRNKIISQAGEIRAPIFLGEVSGAVGSIDDFIMDSGDAKSIAQWASSTTARLTKSPYSFEIRNIKIGKSKVVSIMAATSINTQPCKFIVDGFDFIDGVPSTFNRIVSYTESGDTGVVVAKPSLVQATGAKNAMPENLLQIANALLLPSTTVKIVDTMSGTNENGSWIKYSDGSMVCRTTLKATATFNTVYQGIYKSENLTWTFPKPFVGVIPTASLSTSDNASQNVKFSGLTTSKIDVFGISTVSYATAGVIFDVIVYGRHLL